MPITKSAKKALRQNIRRKQRNLLRKKGVKLVFKKAKKLISQSNYKEAAALIPSAYKSIDKAAKRKILKKNKAARLKSKFVRLVKSPKNQTVTEKKPSQE